MLRVWRFHWKSEHNVSMTKYMFKFNIIYLSYFLFNLLILNAYIENTPQTETWII